MSKSRKAKKIVRAPKRPRLEGTSVVYPIGLEKQLGVSSPTRWRMEKDGRLPKRDFLIGGKPVGWRPETLQAAFAPATAA